MNEDTATAQTAEQPIVKNYPLDKIRPGPNARTDFDEDELKELAASLKETNGTPLQPLVGVPDEDGEGIELIAGERRWRAAPLAGISELPVMHRKSPTEKERLKWHLIENLQRVNLKPLEQARAIAGMLDLEEDGKKIYSTRTLAEELGKSPRYVANCEALMLSSSRVQKAVNEGKVAMEVGSMIGSLPKPLHEAAEDAIIFRPEPLGPMNREQARVYIRENLRRDLRKASFDKEDAALVEDAPACHACPWWGGQRADVEGRGKEHACLNPDCFERKQRAHADVIRRHAEEQNTRILPEAETRRIFQTWDNQLSPECGFVELSKQPDAWMVKDPSIKLPEWGKIIADSGAQLIVAFDANGQPRNLVETKTALSAAQQSDFSAAFKSEAASSVTTASERKDQAAIAKAGASAARETLIAGCIAYHEKLSGPFSEPQLVEILRILFSMGRARCAQRDDAELLCRILHPDLGKISNPIDELERLIEREIQSGRILGMLALAMMIRKIRFDSAFHFAGTEEEESQETRLAKLVEFSPATWDAAITTARKEAEDAAKASLRKKTAKGEKKEKTKGKKVKPEKKPAAENALQVHDRECAHCHEKISAPSEEEFFAHVKSCCKKQPLKKPAKPAPKPKGKPAAKEEIHNEKLGLEIYIATGSLKNAALAAGVGIECVRNWYRRHNWKGARAAAEAKSKKK